MKTVVLAGGRGRRFRTEFLLALGHGAPAVAVSWERDAPPRLASQSELVGLRHEGFFAAVYTPKDLDAMEGLLARGEAPWRRR
jgi:NDP-sugar pyrophosphorylase family protein